MTKVIKLISTLAATLLLTITFHSFSAKFEEGLHYSVVAEKKTSSPELTEYLWDNHYHSIRDGNSVLGFLENYPNEALGGQEGGYMKGNPGHLNIEGAKWLSEYIVKWYKSTPKLI